MTSGPLNLVLLISASGWRGSGVSFAKIAHGLAERGHRILVVTRTPPVTAGFVADGIAATQMQLRNTGIAEVTRLRRVFGLHRAQAVMADTPRDLRLSVLAALFTRRRVVYRYNMNYRRPRTDFGDRFYTSRVAATVFLSEFIQREAHAAGVRLGGSAHLIPNGFDTDVFAPDHDAASAFRREFRLASDDMVVLSAGKLVSGKRIDFGIDAVARVRLPAPQAVYVLCGDGPEEDELKRRAERCGVRAVFTGMVDQKTLRAAYNAADVVLHTGRETFGNVLGEAMSCGRPVISVQEGAAPEVIGPNGQAGALVPSDDVDALTSTLTRLLTDSAERQRMGAAARRRIEKVFPLRRMVSGYEDMFASIVSQQ